MDYRSTITLITRVYQYILIGSSHLPRVTFIGRNERDENLFFSHFTRLVMGMKWKSLSKSMNNPF